MVQRNETISTDRNRAVDAAVVKKPHFVRPVCENPASHDIEAQKRFNPAALKTYVPPERVNTAASTGSRGAPGLSIDTATTLASSVVPASTASQQPAVAPAQNPHELPQDSLSREAPLVCTPGADAPSRQHPNGGAPVVDSIDLTNMAGPLMPPPGAKASVDDWIDFLHQQLNIIGTERPILDGLFLLGAGGNQRLQGGVKLEICMHVTAGSFADLNRCADEKHATCLQG